MNLSNIEPAERIRAILIEHQIDSAEELSRKVKIDGDLIRNVLTGRTKKMSGKVAKAIADNLPVSYAWLMTGEGKMKGLPKNPTLLIPEDIISPVCSICDEKERLIRFLQEQVGFLKAQLLEQNEVIKYQKKCIDLLELGKSQRDTG